jgi:hypothetical protein
MPDQNIPVKIVTVRTLLRFYFSSERKKEASLFKTRLILISFMLVRFLSLQPYDVEGF